MEISEIITFLEPEWTHYQQLFFGAIESPYTLLAQINNHLTSNRGKQIRPLLALLSSRVFGAPTQMSTVVAAVTEMVHTATLLHDDVADQSDTRRGALTVQNLYSPLASVLLGDFWLARAFQLLMDHRGESLLPYFARVIREMSEGELFQMEKAKQFNTNIQDYYQIITKKTATLMAVGMAAGARSAGANETQCALIEQTGLCLGVAFQIRDDILDYSPQMNTGKPVGQDLLEGKMTLPLLCAMAQAPVKLHKEVIGWMSALETNRGYFSNIVDFVTEYRGIAFAQKAIEQKEEEAKVFLLQCPESTARQYLFKVAAYLSGRGS